MQPVKKHSGWNPFKTSKATSSPSGKTQKSSSISSLQRSASPISNSHNNHVTNVNDTGSKTITSSSTVSSKKLPPVPNSKVSQSNKAPQTMVIEGKKYEVEFISAEKHQEIKKGLEAYLDKCIELDKREAEANAEWEKIKSEDDVRLINMRNYFEQSLEELPFDWQKTGQPVELMNIIFQKLDNVIRMIEEYRGDYKNCAEWGNEIEFKHGQLMKEIKVMSDCVKRTNGLKSGQISFVK